MLEPLRKYAIFSGRARRKEFWLWQLLIGVVTAFLLSLSRPVFNPYIDSPGDKLITGFVNPVFSTILFVFLAAIFLPSLAVQVRRLHGNNKSGWWLLLGITGIGSLVLLVFYLLDGTRGPNRFGADPKGRIS